MKTANQIDDEYKSAREDRMILVQNLQEDVKAVLHNDYPNEAERALVALRVLYRHQNTIKELKV